MRIVVDTNIWISALLLPNSKAAKLIARWKNSEFQIIFSKPILEEIKKVLLYPKIKKRIQWDEAKVNQYITLLEFLGELITLDLHQKWTLVERDPDDAPILNTFLQSNADYLVTGDEDLLVLKKQYSILSLAEFDNLFF